MKRAVILAHRGVDAHDAAEELMASAGGSRLTLQIALHHLGQHIPHQQPPAHTSVVHHGADTSLRLAITTLGRDSTAATPRADRRS
ncbi:MAG TPA: hypothetical protein VMZ51_05165 [Acidimicrobiales bacterium]|nr:hypothetical protein [Acidimicrobiales bacterium]